jgi:Putative zinc-finger
MENEIQSGMHCVEFETLLFDAVDGKLVAETLTRFRTHAAGCASCGPLLADAEAGQRWLQSLAEVAPPKNLVHNILAKTSGMEERYQEQATERKPSRFSLNWLRPVLAGTSSGIWATVRQPRFGMSVAMAFFSVSLVMSVAGIKVNDLAKLDLRPSAIRRTYYSTQARVVKYYSNTRIFYELESQVRDIKRATTPAEPAPRDREKERRKENNKTSARPNKEQDQNSDKNGDRNLDRNYAKDETQPVVAQAGEAGSGAADGHRNIWTGAARRDV